MYCTHNASANWVPDVGHKAQMEEARYCFLKGAHLRDEDFLLHHKVEDHFPENKKKPTYQIFFNLNVFKCYVSGFALICLVKSISLTLRIQGQTIDKYIYIFIRI
jgi:hypothetical protein